MDGQRRIVRCRPIDYTQTSNHRRHNGPSLPPFHLRLTIYVSICCPPVCVGATRTVSSFSDWDLGWPSAGAGRGPPVAAAATAYFLKVTPRGDIFPLFSEGLLLLFPNSFRRLRESMHFEHEWLPMPLCRVS